MTFLARLVDDLVRQCAARAIPLHDCAAVFPSRRAGVHFREALRRHPAVSRPLFSPAVFSIEEFISELAGTVPADPLALVFRLYGDYCAVAAEHHAAARPFAEFHQWGRTILTDFDEIDQYLIDPRQLFGNLNAIAQLERYAADAAAAQRVRARVQDDRVHRAYLDFAGLLQPLYARFTAGLDRDGLSYYGRALRRAAAVVANDAAPLTRWPRLVFAGFNALTTGEEAVINAALATGHAAIYWDMDRYFTDDATQEAGTFFRASAITDKASWREDRLASEAKQVRVTGTAGNVAQAKLCGSILRDHLRDGAVPEACAVVLADENLLMPVLHALPPEVAAVNVTMGFPLRHTPVFTFINAIIELHENRRRLGLRAACYFRDAENILLHPYLRALAYPTSYELVNAIRKENLIHVPDGRFTDSGNALIAAIFNRCPQDADDFLAYLLDLFGAIKAGMQQAAGDGNGKPPVDFEYLYAAWTLLVRLRDIIAAAPGQLDPASFRRVLREIIASASIPFTGEPLQGVQVMGVLETRAIDFDRVIILSLNEGVFPAGKGENSLIPYDVRKAVGLPTYEQRDAIYAYHFYRLLTRASHIDLLYNTETTSEIGKAGRSRFIEQLLWELPQRNPRATITESIRVLPSHCRRPQPLAVPKTPELLDTLAARPFSASALNMYLQCPLRFYFRYGLELREPDAVRENAEQSTFGSVIHEVLRVVYRPHIGRPLTARAMAAARKRLPDLIRAAYAQVLKHAELSGRNWLLAEVAKELLGSFLQRETADRGRIIRGIELKVEPVPFTFTVDGQQRTVMLHGTIDRIDEHDGVLRIIDYKTGNTGSLCLTVPDSPASVGSREETIATFATRPEAFQLLFYYQLVQSIPALAGRDAQLMLYAFRKKDYEALRPQRGTPTTLTGVHPPIVAAYLACVFSDLFAAATPFTQTNDADRCACCPYAPLCSR